MLSEAEGLYGGLFENGGILNKNRVSFGMQFDLPSLEGFGGLPFEIVGARHREWSRQSKNGRMMMGEKHKPPGCASLIAAFGFAFDPPFQKLSRRFLSAGDSLGPLDSLGLELLLLSLRWLQADVRDCVLGLLGVDWSMLAGWVVDAFGLAPDILVRLW